MGTVTYKVGEARFSALVEEALRESIAEMSSIAVYYLKQILPVVQDVARRLGYAVAVHGSMQRDFDLVAVPWVEGARPAGELVEAVREAVHGWVVKDGTPGARKDPGTGEFVAATVRNPESKPHGRMAWAIQLGAGAYVDLSVMPTLAPAVPPPENVDYDCS
jgi:hypothetical protein